MLTDFATIDFFTDQSLAPDPHPYFDYLRAKNPVTPLGVYDVVAVTGHEEANASYRDSETYSKLVAVGGPFPPLPFTPEGDDIGEQIEAHRHLMRMTEHMVTMDPPMHTKARSAESRADPRGERALLSGPKHWSGSPAADPPSPTTPRATRQATRAMMDIHIARGHIDYLCCQEKP